MAGAVANFRLRMAADEPSASWRPGATRFGADETVGDLRRRLAPSYGSTAALASAHDPKLWQCDEEGHLVARVPERPGAILRWTTTTSPPELFSAHANGEPRAVLVFTFPPAAPAAEPAPAPAPTPAPAVLFEVPPAIAAFWQAVMHTELVNGFLSLPEGVHWFGNQMLGSRLMVRRCYADLLRLMDEPAPDVRRRNWIVTGNPGVGKTFFAGYAMWVFANRGHTVVWEPPPTRAQERYLFRPDGSVQLGSATARSFDRELRDPMTILIADAQAPPSVNARTLLVTSLRKPVYHEFYKQYGPNLRYMPPWTLDELEVCRASCFANVSEEILLEHFERWGGIASEVLAMARDGRRDDLLETAIASCNVEQCMNSVGEIRGEGDVSHRVIHTSVVDDGTYANPRLRFASEYVAKRLVDKFVQRERDRLVVFLRASEDQGPMAGLRGHLFEHWAHRTLAAGGEFRVRDLSSGRESTLKLPRMPVEMFRSLADLSIVPGVYYRPLAKNMASVDALMAPSVLFQMTVSSDHPIKAAGIESFLDKLARLDPSASATLYFVVPDDIYEGFSKQRFVTTKDTRLPAGQRLDQLMEIRQVALLITLTP